MPKGNCAVPPPLTGWTQPAGLGPQPLRGIVMIRWFYGTLLAASVVSVASAAGNLTGLQGPAGVVYDKSTRMGIATAPVESPMFEDNSPMPPGGSKIVSNFAKYKKGTYICCTGFPVAGPTASGGKTFVGAQFKPATSTTVKTIKLPLQLSSGTGTPTVTVTLNSDNGGLPGAVLHTFPNVTSFPTFPSCCTVTTLTTTGVAVTAGHTYWIVVQPVGNFKGFWNSNEINQTDNQIEAQQDTTNAGAWHGEIFKPGLAFGVFSQ